MCRQRQFTLFLGKAALQRPASVRDSRWKLTRLRAARVCCCPGYPLIFLPLSAETGSVGKLSFKTMQCVAVELYPQNFIPNYGDRYRHGAKISTDFADGRFSGLHRFWMDSFFIYESGIKFLSFFSGRIFNGFIRIHSSNILPFRRLRTLIFSVFRGPHSGVNLQGWS
jgi:hypothetical protein